MIAVDTNILVYAAIASAPHHREARSLLAALAAAPEPWAIPWPCCYEFLRVVTHPRVYHPPLPLPVGRAFLAALFSSPSLLLLSETARHHEAMQAVLGESGVAGNLVHDAHIVALCREHGVDELLTCDKDFLRFRVPRSRHPFVG